MVLLASRLQAQILICVKCKDDMWPCDAAAQPGPTQPKTSSIPTGATLRPSQVNRSTTTAVSRQERQTRTQTSPCDSFLGDVQFFSFFYFLPKYCNNPNQLLMIHFFKGLFWLLKKCIYYFLFRVHFTLKQQYAIFDMEFQCSLHWRTLRTCRQPVCCGVPFSAKL